MAVNGNTDATDYIDLYGGSTDEGGVSTDDEQNTPFSVEWTIKTEPIEHTEEPRGSSSDGVASERVNLLAENGRLNTVRNIKQELFEPVDYTLKTVNNQQDVSIDVDNQSEPRLNETSLPKQSDIKRKKQKRKARVDDILLRTIAEAQKKKLAKENNKQSSEFTVLKEKMKSILPINLCSQTESSVNNTVEDNSTNADNTNDKSLCNDDDKLSESPKQQGIRTIVYTNEKMTEMFCKTVKSTSVQGSDININIGDVTYQIPEETIAAEVAKFDDVLPTKDRPFKCGVCGKLFKRKSHLDTHSRIHLGLKPFSCHICTKSFSQNVNLLKHVATHTGEKPFACDICHKSFGRSDTLQEHIRIHSGDLPYTCEVCLKSFTKNSQLKTHFMIHTGVRPHSCSYCPRKFRKKSQLKVHTMIHTGYMPYRCDICNKSFYHKGNFTIHLRIHTGVKPYMCDICNKGFNHTSNLNIHRKVHTGDRPHACELCGKSFTQKGHLKKHMNVHKTKKPVMEKSDNDPVDDSTSESSKRPEDQDKSKSFVVSILPSKESGKSSTASTHGDTGTATQNSAQTSISILSTSPGKSPEDSAPRNMVSLLNDIDLTSSKKTKSDDNSFEDISSLKEPPLSTTVQKSTDSMFSNLHDSE